MLTTRKALLFCLINIFAVYSTVVFSQISEGGTPPSFRYEQMLRSAIPATNVPIDFYIEDLRATDEWKAREGAPMPVSKLIPVDYSPDNAGYHTILPGGENIWRLRIKAKDAIAIMLYYSDFYIPEGGRLFIYSADKSQVLGAYTHRTHPSGGAFATEFVGGDELILEYVAPETNDAKPRINIRELGYGYNAAALRAFCNITTYATSGFCMVNVNCEEGEAWQNEKKGVCYTVQKVGKSGYICTASLMNNTAEDFKPIMLTALHCAYDGVTFSSEEDYNQWMFYFHREREACSNTSLVRLSKTMTGCTLLASTGLNGGSDGLLLLLNDSIPDSYDVFYNGWDNSGDAALSGVSIHHPQGDYKKISTYNETTRSYSFNSTEFVGDSAAHWNAIFRATTNGHGVTESGSSGAPLYNEKKLIVGTLTGGSSSCYTTRGVNLYGKFSYHWNKYKTDSTTRMDVWLDPLNKGIKTLQGRLRKVPKPSPLNLTAVYLGPSVSLTWEAPPGDETPKTYFVYRNNAKIIETTSLTFSDTNLLFGSIVYSVSAVYEDGDESDFITTALSIIKYKAPTALQAEYPDVNINRVELSWKAPVYEQTIYWGTLEPKWRIGFESKMPFYFGQKWTADEIMPFHLRTITAIKFFPIEQNTYNIYITQGENSYRQFIADSLLKARDMNTINLDTPFVIDGSKSLIVSIFISKVDTDFPAVCDDGPVVNEKGNICALDFDDDDIEWELLNDNEEPGTYNYNFIISAIVSSESGDLPVQTESKPVVTRSPEQTANHHAFTRKTPIPLTENEVSLRNAVPAPFPEITKYRIYKDGSFYEDISPTTTNFLDTDITKDVFYEVSSFYNLVESDKSDKVFVTVIDIDLPDSSLLIYPTLFTNYVSLRGYESVSRIDVLTSSGRTNMVVTHPGEQIDTSSLARGLYFFRITDIHKKQKVIKAIKIR